MSKQTPVIRGLPGKIFAKFARDIGARVVTDPTWGAVGQITFKNGTRRYFRGSSLDINTIGAASISKDKDFAAYFMREMGYPTPIGRAFYSDTWAKLIGSKLTLSRALLYAKKIGYPVIVKPNSGSQGKGIIMAHNDKETTRALESIFAYDDVALIQKPIFGEDYRIVVLDEEIISAYRREPLSIIGDGRSTIRSLAEKKIRAYKKAGRSVMIESDDPRIARMLKIKRLTLRSVTPKGEKVTLLSNANLSTGGDSFDVTDIIHPRWCKLAVRLARDMNLRLCGIDVMTKGSLAKPPLDYCILEINAAPGLDHYVTNGRAQAKLVEDMYRRILRAQARS